MGSQFVPQHVLHSTSVLSHIVLPVTAHIAAHRSVHPWISFSISLLRFFLVCSREQALMVGDQTLLTVFEFLLYNQIYSTVKLPPELHVLNILQHLHLLSPGHVSQSLVVVCCFM
jgi:hypothetical protein